MVSSTVKERILVHLSRYHNHRSKRVVPYDISQPGMADAVGVSRPYLSQVLRKILEDESEIINEELKHVEDMKQRRKVYFLTSEGFRRAKELIERFKSERITVLTSDGKDEILLRDVEEYIEGKNPLLTALSRVDENGVLDLAKEQDVDEDLFVDRKEELNTLEKVSKDVINERGKILFLIGDSGIGKTRLVSEFKDHISKRDMNIIFLSGKAYFKTSDPYLPFKKAFEEFDEDPQIDFSSPLVYTDKTTLNAGDKEKLESRRRSRFFEITKDLKALADKKPLIIFLDDIQWADSATLQLVHYMSENLGDSSVLLIGAFRPHDIKMSTLLKEICQRIKRGGVYNELLLNPLKWEHTKKMITNMLGVSKVPSDFVNIIHDLSEGNPLFTKECVKELKEEGSLDPRENRYPTEPESINVPSVIIEMIERRFDQLPDESQRLLQVGCVIGEEIPLELLLTTCNMDGLDAFDHIDILLGTNIWEEMPEEDMFAFTHSLVHLAAYNSIPEIKKKLLHKKVGEVIERKYQVDIEERYSSLANHFEKAEEIDKAISYYREAGAYAEKVYAHEDARSMYRKALELSSDEENMVDIKWELLESLGDVNSLLGDLSSSRDHYERLLEDIGKSAIKQRIYRKLARTWEIQGDFERAKDLVDRGLKEHEADGIERCRLYEMRGWILMQRGNFEGAEETFEKEKKLSEDIKNETQMSNSYHNLGSLLIHKGKYDEAERFLKEALNLRENLAGEKNIAKTLNNLGVLYKHRGDIMGALDTYKRSLDIQKKIGDRSGTAATLANLGSLRYISGDLDAAEENFNRALEDFKSIGDKRNMAKAMRNLGLIELERGNLGGALEYQKEGLSLKEDMGDKQGIGMVLTAIAEVHVLRGDLEEASDCIKESMSLFEEIGDTNGIALVNRLQGDIKRGEGELSEAIRFYQKSYETLKGIGELFENIKNCIWLAEIFLEKGDIEEAEGYLDDCSELFEELDTDYGRPMYWRVKGKMLRDKGDMEGSLKYLNKALDHLESSKRRLELARTYHEQGLSLLEAGDAEEGKKYLKKAKKEFDSMGLEAKNSPSLSDL